MSCLRQAAKEKGFRREDGHGPLSLIQHPYRRLAAQLRRRPFQRAYTGLPGIVLDHPLQHSVAGFQRVRFHPVLFDLLGQQVPLQDLELFLLRIAGHLDQFHPVQQRRGNRLHRIGSGDEHHLA